MRIQHNIMAMNAYRNLGMNNSKLSKNLEKLSSGYRINRAGDDAAGLAISEKMRAQIAGLDQAQKNAQSGINLVQTAEGALTEVHDMLNRMTTLANQAANGTYTKTDRDKIQAEINALTDEIDRIATNSNFNGTALLDGSLVEVPNAGYDSNDVTLLPTTNNGVVGTNTILHKDGANTQQDPSLTIDLSAISFDSLADDTDNTLSLKVGNVTITTDKLGTSNASEIVTALKDKINANTSGVSEDDGTTAINGIKIGDYAYIAEADGEKLVLKLAANQTLQSTKDFKVNEEVALTTNATKGILHGSINAGSLTITEGKVKSPDVLANTAFELTTDMIEEGNKLKIGDQTFVFTQDGSTEAGTGEILVDLQGVATADLLQVAGEKIAAKDNVANGVFTIGFDGNNKITLQEVTGGATGVDLTTEDNIKAQIQTLTPGTLSEEDAAKSKLTLQIGADAKETIDLEIQSMKAEALGIKGLDISTREKANEAIDIINAAIEKVSVTRGNLGAVQNRLEHTINNLGVMEENIQDAEANIRDTDIADEMMAYTKNNILIQSAQAMLAQANQVPQGVLQLMQ